MSLGISQVEQDLKSLILADLECSKIRSRVLLLEEVETATRFFFWLEWGSSQWELVKHDWAM